MDVWCIIFEQEPQVRTNLLECVLFTSVIFKLSEFVFYYPRFRG